MKIKTLNDILKELGISKVKLAKYLGVSRQMVYNYLDLDSLDNWPKDKKMRMLMLFEIKTTNELQKIEPTNEYIMKIERTLNNNDLLDLKTDSYSYNLKDLGKKEQELLNDIIDLLKELLIDNNTAKMITTFKYLRNFLQLIDDVEELKYVLAYFSKSNGFIKPNEFIYDNDKQITFEGIMYQAMSLFNNGGASKSKVIEAHKRFINDIQYKQEEKLSRTQELNTAKIQALRELGYSEINESNAVEVLEKIAEIQSRKI
jgi:predicted transcriptional regulator